MTNSVKCLGFNELLKKAKSLGDILDSFRDYVEEILQKNEPQTNLLIAKAREEQWISVDVLKPIFEAKETRIQELDVERLRLMSTVEAFNNTFNDDRQRWMKLRELWKTHPIFDHQVHTYNLEEWSRKFVTILFGEDVSVKGSLQEKKES